MGEYYGGLALFALSLAGTVLYTKNVSNRSATDECVTVSAPGKVLVAGGYLVLEKPHIGVTIATTARFYSTVKTLSIADFISGLNMLSSTSSPSPSSVLTINILVDSPQFFTSYHFAYCIKSASIQIIGSETNDFVEKCLTLTMSFIIQYLGNMTLIEKCKSMKLFSDNALAIKLRANNDFYSHIKQLQAQGLPLLSSSLQKFPDFTPCPKGNKR